MYPNSRSRTDIRIKGQDMTDDLLKWRKEFPIVDRTVYLVSHSLGAMPRRTRDRLSEFTDIWASRGVRAWSEGWWEMPRTVGDLIAGIIGAGPGEVIMHQNQSIAQATVLSALDWPANRNRLVTEEINFPSNLYLFHALEREGACITGVPSHDGMTVPLDRMLEAIDERTRLVSISHVVFRSGFVQDLAPIVSRAHEVGALVLVDLYQSAGTVPVDVGATGARLRDRWLRQMALRRTRGRLSVCAARPVADPAATVDRLDGAPAAVCVRGRCDHVRG